MSGLSVLRGLARKFGLGRLLIRTRQVFARGVVAEMRAAIAKRTCLGRSSELPSLQCLESGFTCFMLVHEARAAEGLWALYSFRHFFGPCRIVLLNDGSLSEQSIESYQNLLRGIHIPDFRENNLAIENHLGKLGHNRSIELRRKFVLLRKLIDTAFHSLEREYIVIDSDILQFKTPDDVIQWAGLPEGVRYAADISMETFCVTRQTLEQSFGITLPPLFNSGYICIPPKLIDFARIERALADPIFSEQLQTGRINFFNEQTLFAIEAAMTRATALPPGYAICPDPEKRETVMGHFCGGDAKRTWFYTKGLPILARQLLA